MFLALGTGANAQIFLHAEGQSIVDGNGKNVLLRGLGLGGWMDGTGRVYVANW